MRIAEDESESAGCMRSFEGSGVSTMDVYQLILVLTTGGFG